MTELAGNSFHHCHIIGPEVFVPSVPAPPLSLAEGVQHAIFFWLNISYIIITWHMIFFPGNNTQRIELWEYDLFSNIPVTHRGTYSNDSSNVYPYQILAFIKWVCPYFSDSDHLKKYTFFFQFSEYLSRVTKISHLEMSQKRPMISMEVEWHDHTFPWLSVIKKKYIYGKYVHTF